MISVLLAMSSAVAPLGAEAVAAAACSPAQQSACSTEAQPRARDVRIGGVRVGKRCHPDPTKSKSCREVLPDSNARKEAALADAR